MEDQLKGLRKSMENTTFKHLSFSDQHRKQVREKINASNEKEEDISLAILQLLSNEKTGYELSQLLRGRGIRKFEGNEGFLYTVLHRLEQNRLIQSSWDHAGAKYYQLNDKGRKMLRKAEKNATKVQFILKGLVQE
ncbi:TPA: PadR family transcriptional regulator [Bacillus thuringiensis]|jgi:DNA-binding PadR family transcriptional regulator|uniref:Lineage-specific thermal regulator protein n=4 Tax=Bacillus cereus group TaxID=86661 RepID=A0A9X6KBK7_BACTU|nr:MULTISPECIES: PadR family transcriptional regulator [Bacillus]BCA35452.1 PadR family transcriptional regulator [Bacillus wiedmannii]AGE76770.1 Transcriptional regulator, PadR [Bacillus thuringiensis serovar kurstaki str. HD73]AHZ49940.1 lineage-specific thermal regulator protein [Bacillus thuringiensis serovar kurstaki str. YBT-1520]AIE32316.1 lineage-specific thermal regulator protein [Bacillus thuringiensis serovar kurstaki str. HD-1]AJA18543.1 lineage-specific thermal regulator protein [